MRAMKRLAGRIRDEAQDGATLLAISAWHFYPKIMILADIGTRMTRSQEAHF